MAIVSTLRKTAAGFALGLVLIAGASACAPPRPTHETIEASLLANAELGQMAQAWKENDPQGFGDFVDRLLAAQESGQTREQMVETTRAQLLASAGPRLARLPDADTQAFMAVVRDEFRELERTRPQACVAMFRGEPFGDIASALSPGVRRRELAVMASAFRVKDTPPVLQGDALRASLSDVMTRVRGVVGGDVEMLYPGSNLIGRETRFCEVAATFYDQLVSMPPAEGASVMRALLSAAASP